jgi:type II secretion system protein G
MKFFYSKSLNKGFTLIELLIVLAILSILTSILIPKLSESRVKARDAKRLQDMKNITTALNMYYLDNGHLPRTNTYGGANPGGWDYSSQGSFLSF